MNSRKLLAKIAENWLAKVLSIALAIFLFAFHRMSTLETRFFSVPLDLEYGSSLVPSSSYTRMVRVSLRGDANSIYSIMEDDIDAFVDLSRFNAEGSYRVPVQVRKGGTALGVEPLEISVDPLEISLELDRKISKYVPLTANIRGNLQSGYDLVSHTLTPTQVVVDGPMNLLGGISELYTDLIDLDGRNADFVVTVNILNRDPLLTIRGNGQTEFHGFVRKLVPVKNIEGLPITVVGLPEEFAARTDLKLGSARIEGTQADLDLFRPPALFLTVDCSGVTEEGTYTLPVQIQLPPELNLIKLDPQDITVTVGSKDGADQ